ncbi:hypothetical protein [Roseibium aggregatum]|uniref:hypothetical protein n=1 Tax=Roseibium aggregatum TaxID=187304 RepID=UPI003A976A7E
MLFNYPVDATNENWLSEVLIQILRDAIEAVRDDTEPSVFQDAIPVAYQAEIGRARKFPELYLAFVESIKELDDGDLGIVLDALDRQNSFPALFDVHTPCPNLNPILPRVHQVTRELFEYAFKKLSELRTPGAGETIRANYHVCVAGHLESGCCPFCGLEFLEAPDPDLVNPDLDHYLAVSKYPFAGANLRNLTAMGTVCNRSYKGAKDILLDEHDQKTDCIDPYGDETVTVSLTGTVLLPGAGEGPTWSLQFVPDVRSRNWRRVFKLETRLTSTVLEKQYQNWLKHCVDYASKKGIDVGDRRGALLAVREFKDTCAYADLPTIALLKTSFFEIIEKELNDPENADRVHNFIRAV